jgi:hypothetical protein
MIRQANKFDKKEVIEMMLKGRKEVDINIINDMDNQEWWEQIFDSILAGRGFILLAEGKGLIMGVKTPSLWCGKTILLCSLAWYVQPEFRHTSIGHKLFSSFMKVGKELKQAGTISQIVVGKMHNSPTLNYDRRGFIKMEETWISSL